MFIETMQKELNQNLNVQMSIATETNIKNALIEGVEILHFSCHGKYQ